MHRRNRKEEVQNQQVSRRTTAESRRSTRHHRIPTLRRGLRLLRRRRRLARRHLCRPGSQLPRRPRLESTTGGVWNDGR